MLRHRLHIRRAYLVGERGIGRCESMGLASDAHYLAYEWLVDSAVNGRGLLDLTAYSSQRPRAAIMGMGQFYGLASWSGPDIGYGD